MSRNMREGTRGQAREDVQEGTKPMVMLRNVSRSYIMGSREVHALRDVSMTVPQGVLATIQGPSGSGKTTLLNIIGAMDVPDSGTVKVAGQELGRLTDESLTEFRRTNVGFVFQFFNLIPSLNAVENVLVPSMFEAEPPVDRAMELLERVGLTGRWDHRPAQLSGGERQRLAVARALIKGPALVLADEPTGNLDNEAGAGILRLFEDLVGEGQTVMVVTHDGEVASRGTHRFVLRDGAMSEQA